MSQPTPMSQATPQFPIGTIVILATGAQAAGPASFHPGDDLIVESTTGGKASCRVAAINPERIDVICAAVRYSLSPAAATLDEGGVAGYGGGWVVRSITGL